MAADPWHIITGEYPPGRGGVADYTRSVARGLAMAGDEVHVWAPAAAGGLVEETGVEVHPLRRGFGPRGLWSLARAFSQVRQPRRLLVQYVPQAFGLRGMNVPFCAWVASLADTQVWVMFHEVFVWWRPWWRLRTAALAAATRTMATLLAARADRTFVSVPSWEPILSSLAPRRSPARWLPVPSNLPAAVASGSRADVRGRLGLGPETPLIGHFGTYGSLMAPLLTRAALKVLEGDPRRRLLLLGRGGQAFVRELAASSAVTERIIATGELEAHEVAAHLTACDILVQPYADGVSTRRGSAMAGLALGLPVVTNEGWLTESIWREFDAVVLAPGPDSVGEAANVLLRDPARAAALGRRGRELYRARFSIEHTVQALREPRGNAS
jgi:glycosyltransferase involved in cell wall biosynthesis